MEVLSKLSSFIASFVIIVLVITNSCLGEQYDCNNTILLERMEFTNTTIKDIIHKLQPLSPKPITIVEKLESDNSNTTFSDTKISLIIENISIIDALSKIHKFVKGVNIIDKGWAFEIQGPGVEDVAYFFDENIIAYEAKGNLFDASLRLTTDKFRPLLITQSKEMRKYNYNINIQESFKIVDIMNYITCLTGWAWHVQLIPVDKIKPFEIQGPDKKISYQPGPNAYLFWYYTDKANDNYSENNMISTRLRNIGKLMRVISDNRNKPNIISKSLFRNEIMH
jgi:hypothetical protein